MKTLDKLKVIFKQSINVISGSIMIVASIYLFIELNFVLSGGFSGSIFGPAIVGAVGVIVIKDTLSEKNCEVKDEK